MECQVCIQKYNKKRLKITCPECAYEACVSCIQTYMSHRLVGQRSKISCMNCHQGWSDFFVHVHFPKSFCSLIWKNWRLEELLEYEMSLMPETQKKIEFMQEQEAIQQTIQIYDEEIAQLMRRVRDMQMLKRVSQYELESLKNNWVQSQTQKHSSTRPCPNTSCRGYLNSELICSLCHSQTCKQCFCEIGSGTEAHHICLKENLESAKVILQETKSCPKCGVPIIKIEGCDQIWCTGCNTAFNWHTHKIIVFSNSVFHNPHYADWYKTTINSQQEMDASIDVFLPIFYDKYKKLLTDSFHRSFRDNEMFLHIKDIFGERLFWCKRLLRHQIDTQPKNHISVCNEKLRLDYLNHRIDLPTMTTQLKKRMKKQRIQQENRRIVMSFIQQGKQLMYDYYHQVFQALQNIPKRRSRSEVLKEQDACLIILFHLFQSFENRLQETLNAHYRLFDEVVEIYPGKRRALF